MAYSLDTVTDDILDYLRANLVQDVYDDYRPNTDTLRRNELGELVPYVVVQFGDLQPQNSYSMTGPVDDDYGLPVYIQSISAEARMSRRISNVVVQKLLGMSFPWAGNVRKRPGFGTFTIDSSDGAVEAYSSPAFFTVTVQLAET